MLSFAGRSPTLTQVLVSILVVAGALFLAKNVIARALIGVILRQRTIEPFSDLEDDSIDAFMSISTEDEGNIYRFVVWSLLDRIRKMIAPWTSRTVMVVHAGGVPYSSYPDDAINELALEDVTIDPSHEIYTIMPDDDTIEFWISYRVYAALKEAARRGFEVDDGEEGEAIEVSDPKTLEAIYRIVKQAYKTINKGAPEELAAYIAIKTIIRLDREGVIKIRQPLAYILPEGIPEGRELRRRLKEQLEEEGLLNTTGGKLQKGGG